VLAKRVPCTGCNGVEVHVHVCSLWTHSECQVKSPHADLQASSAHWQRLRATCKSMCTSLPAGPYVSVHWKKLRTTCMSMCTPLPAGPFTIRDILYNVLCIHVHVCTCIYSTGTCTVCVFNVHAYNVHTGVQVATDV